MKLSKLIPMAFSLILTFFIAACSQEKSDTVRWFNATHAILTATNQGDVEIYGGEKPSAGAKQTYRNMLKEWWDITNKEQLVETIITLAETNSPKDVAAWDYSRAFGLLSAGYLAEYLTREQALNMSLELAKKVQPLYHSWDEFFEGYFKGYEQWSEKSSELRRKTYQLIKNYDNSPYNLPWNLELKKDW